MAGRDAGRELVERALRWHGTAIAGCVALHGRLEGAVRHGLRRELSCKPAFLQDSSHGGGADEGTSPASMGAETPIDLRPHLQRGGGSR